MLELHRGAPHHLLVQVENMGILQELAQGQTLDLRCKVGGILLSWWQAQRCSGIPVLEYVAVRYAWTVVV
jgi:hypothetical protein